MSALLEQYRTEVMPALKKSRGYTNDMQIPRLSKITLSVGIGTAKEKDQFEEAIRTLTEISGQKPVITVSNKNIASFKLREGQNVGVCVTLRGQRMYDFFYRLVRVALPRVRDFRGVNPKSFDGRGNYSMGLNDQTIFTEINLDRMKHTIGMNITVVTTAKTNEEAHELLKLLGVPFAQ